MSRIAIVGLSLRLPGARSPGTLWQALLSGRVMIGASPQARWRHRSAVTERIRAGFLDDIDAFDPDLFGISPREAAVIDPQQRMLLELTVEALQDAGILRAEVAGTNAGVFVGACTLDYALSMFEARTSIEASSGTAVALSMCANRISYQLDLHGPSFTTDSACSSSAVALYQACQALRSGDTDLAIVGACNLLLRPEMFVAYEQMGIASPTSECRSFDAAANGTVRGEGAGIVILQREEDAIARGRPGYANIETMVVHQDGRTAGPTAPNRLAQEALLAQAYKSHDLSRLAFVEAHGTGTSLGDVIEANALGNTLKQRGALGRERWLASIKNNIGHLDAAAGMAGLIKICLVMKNRIVPPQAAFAQDNTQIPFAEHGLRIPRSPQPLPDGRDLLLGLSSFGFGGTIAHAVLSPPGEAARRAPTPIRPWTLPLSAHDPAALTEHAQRLAAWLEAQTDDVAAAGIAEIACHRDALPYRAAIAGKDKAEVVRALRTLTPGERAPRDPRVVWIGSPEQLASTPLVRQLFDAIQTPVVAALELNDGTAIWHDLRTNERRACETPEALAASAKRSAGRASFLVVGPRHLPELLSTALQGVNVRATFLRTVSSVEERFRFWTSAFAEGAAIDWRRCYGPVPPTDVPTLALLQKRFWFEPFPYQDVETRAASTTTTEPQNVRTSSPLQTARQTICRLLGRDEIPEDVPLLELGVDSLIAAQVAADLLREHGLTVSHRPLIEGASFAALRELITAAGVQTPPTQAPVAAREAVTDYGASAIQRAIWRIAAFEPREHRIYRALTFDNPVPGEIFRAAMQRMQERHSLLRATFSQEAETLRVRVHPQTEVAFREVDLTHLSPSDQANAIDADTLVDFSPGTPPLMRGAFYRTANDKRVFVLGVHHILADAHATGLLGKDFVATAMSMLGGDPQDAGAAGDYGAYAKEEQAYLASAAADEARRYWLGTLDGLVITPTRELTHGVQGFGITCREPLADETVERLERVAANARVTKSVVGQAFCHVLSSRLLGKSDSVLGLAVSTRDLSRHDNTVGPMFNWLPQRARVDEKKTVAQLIAGCADLNRSSDPYVRFPHLAIIDAMGARFVPSVRGCFQVLYNYLRSDGTSSLAPAGLAVTEYPLRIRAQTFDLPFYVLIAEAGAKHELHIAFSPRFFDTRKAQLAFATARRLFDELVTKPEARLSDLQIGES